MKVSTIAVVIVFAAAWMVLLPLTTRHAGLAQPPGAAATQSTLRIGVYDSRAVIIGARESDAFNLGIKELMKQKDAAEAAGDKKRIEELKREGQAAQTLRHLQAFSIAPIDDILDPFRDKLPDIAAKAGVDLIVARPDYLAPGIQTVDVTDELIALFHPGEKTLKTAAGIRKHKPISLLEALLIKD